MHSTAPAYLASKYSHSAEQSRVSILHMQWHILLQLHYYVSYSKLQAALCSLTRSLILF